MDLIHTSLFHNINPEDISGLLSCVNSQTRTFKKGEILLHRGEISARFGLLLSGNVHIIREDFWGTRSIVGIAGPGEIFAESYALAHQPLEVSVLAASDVEVLFLDAEKIISGCQQVCSFHAQLSRNLLFILAQKNLNLTTKIRHMSRKTTREKLMSYLSAQALRAGSSVFEIPLDRQQLADFLGVERSAMSATLSRLRDEGILTFHKNQFHLLQHDEED